MDHGDEQGVGTTTKLTDSLAAMAGLLLSEQTVEAILAMLVAMACQAMAGVDGASVSLVRSGLFVTTTATSDDVREADGVQYLSGKGPCIEATRQAQTVNIGLSASRSRWPDFSDAAVAGGFVGVLSTPMSVHQIRMGSLNLYSRTQDRFSASEERAAQTFADQASVVLSNASAFATAGMVNDQLREALASRDVIGQAKGMLMEREGCSPDEAFDMLRRASQRVNRKVRDVAADMIKARRSGEPAS